MQRPETHRKTSRSLPRDNIVPYIQIKDLITLFHCQGSNHDMKTVLITSWTRFYFHTNRSIVLKLIVALVYIMAATIDEVF